MDIGSRSKRVLPAIGISAGILAFTAGTAGTAGAADIPFNAGTSNACEQVLSQLRDLPTVARESRDPNALSITQVRSATRTGRCR